uniref:PDZ domain-containing protein n=1 Tax=Panagrolaimus davidi TaxID=227884 RepID=A0A914QQW6_9BILA
MGDAGKEFVVEIQMEEGEPLGATPNDKMFIVKVQAGTLSEGKLKLGDQIVKVNGTTIRDTNHFFQLLRFAPPVARLQVIRDEKRAEELEAKVHIPAERSKYIQRRDGFVYNMVKIEWKPGGPKLGLGIKHYQNRVLVSRCDAGSLASQQLAIGDHIIDIDGKIVSDKDVARDFLLKSLQAQGFVTCVVERPESYEAKHWTQQALTANAAQPPSVAMNSDVRDIAARERTKMKERNAAAKKPGILGRTQKSGRVQIGDKIAEFVIASDNEGKNLRSVRK